jgi:hypothetical protein
VEVAKVLTSGGANVNTRVWLDRTYENRGGEMAFTVIYALGRRHEVMVHYLRSQGAAD